METIDSSLEVGLEDLIECVWEHHLTNSTRCFGGELRSMADSINVSNDFSILSDSSVLCVSEY